MPKDELQKLREVKITQILNLSSGRQAIKCPFHKEKSPSCVLYPDGSYHCYGCGAHGNNAIDFLVGLGISFKQAVEELKKYC